MKIVIMHPGEMGAAVAAALHDPVFWLPEGRSEATSARAEAAGMTPIDDPLTADAIVSICPPVNAVEIAEQLSGFTGLYVDANAISPATSREVAKRVPQATFADGGIVGPPPRERGTTRLYLSGDGAQQAARLFTGTRLEPRIVQDASAMKMAFAAWMKGSQALLLATHAAAQELGVEADLRKEWETMGLLPRLEAAQQAKRTKGWRWSAEMEEIADTFAAAGQPQGFHRAAAEVFKD